MTDLVDGVYPDSNEIMVTDGVGIGIVEQL